MNLKAIYEPKGRAAEYADLAVNLYQGCTHGCAYCYAPTVLYMDRATFHSQCIERPGILDKLRSDAKRLVNSTEWQEYGWKYVLFCFSCDPYQPGAHATRAALSIMREFDIPFTVLTKGTMAWRDFDLYGRRDRFGVTLTFDNDADSAEWEPGAAKPAERMAMLRDAHLHRIKTWVSLEPVIDPAQTLRIIDATHEHVDHYAVGKLNYHPHAATIDWPQFRAYVLERLNQYPVGYQIKKDLWEARRPHSAEDEAAGGEG